MTDTSTNISMDEPFKVHFLSVFNGLDDHLTKLGVLIQMHYSPTLVKNTPDEPSRPGMWTVHIKARGEDYPREVRAKGQHLAVALCQAISAWETIR